MVLADNQKNENHSKSFPRHFSGSEYHGHVTDDVTRQIPANTKRWPNAGLTLAHRLRRWANIKLALD